MTDMQGLWLEDQVLSFRADIPIPVPPPGEALVKVRLAGICATDLELVHGYYPYTGIPGHEFVGQVTQAPGHEQLEGKRVVGEINAACGSCVHCRNGRKTHCIKRTVLGIVNRHGALAEYLTLPVKNLHVVPDEIPDDVAVFTEPLAAALEIQEQITIRPRDRVLVIGAGRLGQLIASTLALTGCDLQVVVRHDRQAEIMADQKIRTMGIEDVPTGTMDIVIEATGAPSGFALARQAVRARGLVVLKSTYHGDLTLNMSSIVVEEITLVGSRCGPFPPALRLLADGWIDPRPMIQKRAPLREGLVAFEYAARPGILKVLIEPDGKLS